MIQQIKGRLVTALKTVFSKLMSFAKVRKIKVPKDIQNMIASTALVGGIAIVAGASLMTLKEASIGERTLSAILLGSTASEAVSPGIGLNLIHYILIGSVFLVSGTAFFLRNNSVLHNIQHLVLTQFQRVKTKKVLRNTTKKPKSAGAFKLKIASSRTEINFKHASSKVKLKLSPVFVNASRFRTKMETGFSRFLHNVSVYSTQKRKQTIIISVVAASAILNVFFLTAISAQFFVKNDIYSYGTVQIQTQTAGLNVYSNSACTTKVSSLPWGSVTPGGTVSNLVYIKNEGNVPLTLTLDTTDWSPINAPNYIALKWNYNGEAVEPNQVVLVRLNLSVSPSINGIQSFNFQILINGSG